VSFPSARAALIGALVSLLSAAALSPALAAARPSVTSGAPVWQAKVDPVTGDDQTYLRLVTSGGCPAPATNVIGRVYGNGLPVTGEVVIGNTSAGVDPYSPMTMPFGVTMRDVVFQQSELFRLAGSYRLVLTCRTASNVHSYGEYEARITFTTPTSWHAEAPLTAAKGPVAARPEPAALGPTSAPGAQGTAPAGATGPAAAAPADSSARGRPVATMSAARAVRHHRSWPAFVLAALIVLLVLGYFWRTRARALSTSP
jgi:hypothetical protein